MNQRTDKTGQPSEMEKMDGVKICEIIDIKSLEIIDILQQFVGCLEKSVEMHRKETEDWNKEREEHFKMQREMFKDQEELWKQMQLWFEQNKNIRPRSTVADECFDCGAPVIPPQNQSPNFPSEIETRYFVGPAASLSANSEDEQEENIDVDVEYDMEAVRGVDDEDEEDIEEQEEEDPEATGLDFVQEYTPVTSAMELPGLSGRTEDGKRKDGDKSKRRRLTLVECPVCQEALPEMARSGKLLMVATCGHVLCSNCAMRVWIQRRRRCPKCNTRFDIKNLLPVYL